MPSKHELQEVVALLSKLITQMAFVLTSKTDQILNSFAIIPIGIAAVAFLTLFSLYGDV